MDRLPLIISGFTEAAGRLGGIAAQILRDRLDLLALKLREARIRFVQALLLTCMGVVFSLLGLLSLILAADYPNFCFRSDTYARADKLISKMGNLYVLDQARLREHSR
jgi:uncharacterized membrane protein YqjE